MNARVKKIKEHLTAKKLDAILIKNPYNIRYFSNFVGSDALVLITTERDYLLTDFRYIEQAKKQAQNFQVIDTNKKQNECLQKIFIENNIEQLGFEENFMVYQAYENFLQTFKSIKLVPINQMIIGLRLIKDEHEKQALRKAAGLADEAFSYIVSRIKPGVTELEISLDIEFFLRRNGSEARPFDFIVASGKRAALPHGTATEKKISKGEMVVLDFGAVVDGYCSDITRTVFVGEPDNKQKNIYKIVLQAQKIGIEGILSGITCQQADELSRKVIVEQGYGEFFGHALGHGVGLEVHEEPRVAFGNELILQPGMVITVEPGIYIKDWGGIRIEDMLIINKNNSEVLTKSSKELHVLC